MRGLRIKFGLFMFICGAILASDDMEIPYKCAAAVGTIIAIAFATFDGTVEKK